MPPQHCDTVWNRGKAEAEMQEKEGWVSKLQLHKVSEQHVTEKFVIWRDHNVLRTW